MCLLLLPSFATKLGRVKSVISGAKVFPSGCITGVSWCYSNETHCLVRTGWRFRAGNISHILREDDGKPTVQSSQRKTTLNRKKLRTLRDANQYGSGGTRGQAGSEVG